MPNFSFKYTNYPTLINYVWAYFIMFSQIKATTSCKRPLFPSPRVVVYYKRADCKCQTTVFGSKNTFFSNVLSSDKGSSFPPVTAAIAFLRCIPINKHRSHSSPTKKSIGKRGTRARFHTRKSFSEITRCRSILLASMSASYFNEETAPDRYLGSNTNIFGLPSREGHLSLVKSDVIVLMSMGLSSVPHNPCSLPVLRMMQQKQSLLEKSLCAVSVSAFNMSLVVRPISSLVVKPNSAAKTPFSRMRLNSNGSLVMGQLFNIKT